MTAGHRTRTSMFIVTLAIAIHALPAVGAATIPKVLPDPDGKPADTSKPVQVYILMGQSNMLGFGKISQLKGIHDGKGKYPYLFDDAGNNTVRKDVRNVRVMCSGNKPARDYNNEWMSLAGKNIGPEIGIGHYVGHVTDAPVMILKSCIGNRSLGWDLLPPGSKPYEHGGKTLPGYRGTPDDPVGNGQPVAGKWYAGCQYDGDTAAAKKVLSQLGKYYPGATRFQVAGFFFWQGDKDFRNKAHAAHYEKNLVNLIAALRKDFNSPDAFFVVATLGQTDMNAGGTQGQILKAQLAIGDWRKYPKYKGTTASVYSKPFSQGSSSSGHYGGNAETYMDIGEAMGRAMAQLIVNKSPKKAKEMPKKKKKAAQAKPKVDPGNAKAEKLFRTARSAERMRQFGVAKTFYKMIISKYPKTPAAEKAKKRLERF